MGRKARKIREQAAVIDELHTQVDAAKADASSYLSAAVRTAKYNDRLRELLDEQRPAEDADAAYAQRLEERLERALRAAARYLEALWKTDADADTVVRELARVKKLLRRADEDRRALHARLTEVQDANDVLSREAVDRAGTLTPRKTVST